jgi:hypothetical protein
MNQRTDLAAGAINASDRLVIELIVPPDMPPVIAITWPAKPTVCTPGTYAEVAAAAMRLLANASTALARIKAHGGDARNTRAPSAKPTKRFTDEERAAMKDRRVGGVFVCPDTEACRPKTKPSPPRCMAKPC